MYCNGSLARGRSWTANDWGRFLGQLSHEDGSDDGKPRYRDKEGRKRLFPKQTRDRNPSLA